MSNPQDKCAIVYTVGFALLLCKQSIIFYLPATIDAGSLRSDSAAAQATGVQPHYLGYTNWNKCLHALGARQMVPRRPIW